MKPLRQMLESLLNNKHPKARYVSWPVGSVKNGRGEEVLLRRGRWIWPKGGRYMPHQGAQECARRIWNQHRKESGL